MHRWVYHVGHEGRGAKVKKVKSQDGGICREICDNGKKAPRVTRIVSWNVEASGVELREGSWDGELREEYDKRAAEQFCGFSLAFDSSAESMS